MKRLSEAEIEDIVRKYEGFTPMIELAKEYGVTRQAIHKTLNRCGVDTKKRLIDVSCNTCQVLFKRNKKRIKTQLHNFCTPDCYFAFLDAGGKYKESSYGRRSGRSKVLEVYPLRDKQVVHHEDGNQNNNSLGNLRVFASQGDHVRYHRGFDVIPVWSMN